MSTFVYLASIAASGNSGAQVFTNPDYSNEYFEVRVTAKYAAVAATTGVSVAVTVTLADGAGTQSFPAFVVPGVVGLSSNSIRVGSRSINGMVASISVTATNTDATNAAITAIDVTAHKE